uniref:coiled-coil domain-containing protein 33 n=1 Tax=Centroberyx gerrardi TaxID=166262 RepID=UPI003AADFB6A
MQRSPIRVEEQELDLEFEVVNVQFNQLGQYVLALTVENPLLHDSAEGVQLRLSDRPGDILRTNSGCTDAIEQTSLDEVCTCVKNRFVFTLPKGFCKNDKNHDVRLKVEAVREDRTKAGEGFFAIYPRTDAPRINLFVGRGEELYQYSGIMALLRVHNDYLSMHCGRLVYTASFHEARPYLKNMSSSSHMFPLSVGDPVVTSGGEDSSVPEPQEFPTPKSISATSQIPSPQSQPHTKLEQRAAADTRMESSSESLSTPQGEGSSSPDLYCRTPGQDNLLSSEILLTHPTPEPLPYKQVIEDPRDGKALVDDIHVSRPGTEVVIITLHGARDLPPLNDGEVPQPFAIVKSGVDESCGRQRRGATRCTLQPTHCPSWEERLSIELQAHGEVVVLNVADGRSKELLAHYRLPVAHLQPFHHYHLELVQAHCSAPSGACLYVSVIRKVSILPRQPHFSFTGFEAMETPLKEPVGSLLTVARIVPNYHSYRDAMLLSIPRAAGIAVTTIYFPHPSESAFHPPHLTAQGRPQVSQVGSPEEQPVWNHSFLFLERDCATMFTGAAALVLEYYSATTVMNAVNWHIRSPLGFSALPLHQELYRKLMSETGQMGMKVEKLPLRGSTLQTTTDTSPAVSIALRLLCSERPESVLTAVNTTQLLSLDSESLEETEWTPMAEPPLPLQTDQEEGSFTPIVPPSQERHAPLLLSIRAEWGGRELLGSCLVCRLGWAAPFEVPCSGLYLHSAAGGDRLQKDGYSLPSHDALAQILPDYQNLFNTTKTELHSTVQQEQDGAAETAEAAQSNTTKNINQTYQVHHPHKRPPLPDFEDDPHMAEIADLQTKEVENYRSAMHRMAEDIIGLRTQVVTVEAENSQLRSDLSLHQDLGRDLLDDTDIDVMTKAEIADRIAHLKHKLASETTKAASQRDRIQQLQNELIRKNDSEKKLLKLQRAHQQQQEDLQRHQSRVAKMAGLEATVKQQEKVIEKMEKALDNKLAERNKQNGEKKLAVKKQRGETDGRKEQMESALAAENARLRGELEKTRQQPAPIIIQQLAQTIPDMERLSLLSKLEKAEARIETLETQLEESSKLWGRQKQDMLTKLNEHRHGFARTSTTILHNVPLVASDSLYEQSRKQKPVK